MRGLTNLLVFGSGFGVGLVRLGGEVESGGVEGWSVRKYLRYAMWAELRRWSI